MGVVVPVAVVARVVVVAEGCAEGVSSTRSGERSAPQRSAAEGRGPPPQETSWGWKMAYTWMLADDGKFGLRGFASFVFVGFLGAHALN